MIFSKMNLLAVEMTKADKAIPVLDNVHFRTDGTTIGTNGLSVLAVSPVKVSMAEKVPIDNTKMSTDETVSSETVKEILKNMPRDAMFSGVLEHCDYAGGKFSLTDGKRRREIAAKTYPRDYIEYKKVFERAGNGKVKAKSAVNLRRLLDVLLCIQKMCPDSAKNQAVFLEFTEENDIVIRSENQVSAQRVVSIVKTYNVNEEAWLERDLWEETLMNTNANANTMHARAHVEARTRTIRKLKRV